MQRQRDGLVPIGDALADLGGPVKAIREASPRRCTHFTRFDQVNQLVRASRSGPRPRLHGAADGALLAAPHPIPATSTSTSAPMARTSWL